MGEVDLALSELGEVDPAFIQPLEYRPKLKFTEAVEIPLIDLSLLLNSDQEIPDPDSLKGIVSEIGEACEKWGFFEVINHGVERERLQKVVSVAKQFYHQPIEEKRKVKRDEVNFLGYNDAELTKNVRDWKECFDIFVSNPTMIPVSPDPDDKEVKEYINQWPDFPSEMRETCEAYTQEVLKLAYKLLELISLSLGLPAKRLNGLFKDHNSILRFNYYTPCHVPHLVLGIGPHKDPGALTVLATDDVAGLEVKRKTDGEWLRVKPTPNAYIINLGDIMQAWSNEKYESVEHRVTVNSVRERLSVGLSFNPGHHVIVEPLEELINEQSPAKYKPYNWGKFFASKRRSFFKKLDVENIQISHFKIAE